MSPSLPSRLQELLDQAPGGDPLEDPRVAEWLEQHPEHLEAFAALRGRARVLAEATSIADPTPAVPRSGRRFPWPLLAAAAVAAFALWWGYPVPEPRPAPANPLPRPNLGAASLVRYSASREFARGGGQAFSATTAPGLVTARRRTTLRTATPQAPLVHRSISKLTFEETLLP